MSKLVAVGMSARIGDYRIKFFYRLPQGGQDLGMPIFEVPARSFENMQNTVRAFNDGNINEALNTNI